MSGSTSRSVTDRSAVHPAERHRKSGSQRVATMVMSLRRPDSLVDLRATRGRGWTTHFGWPWPLEPATAAAFAFHSGLRRDAPVQHADNNALHQLLGRWRQPRPHHQRAQANYPPWYHLGNLGLRQQACAEQGLCVRSDPQPLPSGADRNRRSDCRPAPDSGHRPLSALVGPGSARIRRSVRLTAPG
jgi:hypothetical protein